MNGTYVEPVEAEETESDDDKSSTAENSEDN